MLNVVLIANARRVDDHTRIRGVALAKHGDLVSAEAKLKNAVQRGPHWAHPLKAWGDVLAKQGKTKEAFAKFDEALIWATSAAWVLRRGA